MQLAQGIETMISTEESRAVFDQYAKIPINPSLEKQLAEVTKRLEEAIAADKQFCFIDQPLLDPTTVMLRSKGFSVERIYEDHWSDIGIYRCQEKPGFYIDVFPGASADARRKEAKERKEQERKTLEFAKMLTLKGECCHNK